MLRIPRKHVQSGFTLIELIIVIVVIGILAAVAIPKFSDVSTAATTAKNAAILGAVKSAWGVALITTKPNNPTAAQVATQMSDPTCTAPTTTTMSCATTPALALSVTLTGTTVASPADITCTTASDCQ
jgi:prepilin-type N-terminal cleavage/methylation domain-containing protein